MSLLFEKFIELNWLKTMNINVDDANGIARIFYSYTF